MAESGGFVLEATSLEGGKHTTPRVWSSGSACWLMDAMEELDGGARS